MLIEPAGRAPHPDGARDDLAEVDRLADEGHPAGRDAAHLEEVVDETGEMLALSADHAVRLLGHRLIGLRDVQQGDSARDGAQRVSELVSQHRQELVLRPVRPLGLRLGGSRRLRSLLDGVGGGDQGGVDAPDLAEMRSGRLGPLSLTQLRRASRQVRHVALNAESRDGRDCHADRDQRQADDTHGPEDATRPSLDRHCRHPDGHAPVAHTRPAERGVDRDALPIRAPDQLLHGVPLEHAPHQRADRLSSSLFGDPVARHESRGAVEDTHHWNILEALRRQHALDRQWPDDRHEHIPAGRIRRDWHSDRETVLLGPWIPSHVADHGPASLAGVEINPLVRAALARHGPARVDDDPARRVDDQESHPIGLLTLEDPDRFVAEDAHISALGRHGCRDGPERGGRVDKLPVERQAERPDSVSQSALNGGPLPLDENGRDDGREHDEGHRHATDQERDLASDLHGALRTTPA